MSLTGPLACISHRLSAAARDKDVSTSLRLVSVLDVLSKYASARWPARARPRPHGLLTRLATKPGQNFGLICEQQEVKLSFFVRAYISLLLIDR